MFCARCDLLPATKSSKATHFAWYPDTAACDAGELAIESERGRTTYRVTEFPTGGQGWEGRGFRLVKIAGGSDALSESYDVFCGRRDGQSLCDCRGFARFGYCKHTAALAKIISNGWASSEARPEPAAAKPAPAAKFTPHVATCNADLDYF